MKSTCQNFWRAAQFNASALYLEGIVAGRQVRVVRLVVIAGINPCIVESSHLVEVMDALVVAVVDGRKGDAEAVLFVA